MTTTDVATGRAGLIRVAAVGDVHVTAARAGRFRPALLRLRELADLVLLAGDLTERGTVTEAVYLADELRGLGLPAVAVLGNHDHLSGPRGAAVVAAALADAGLSCSRTPASSSPSTASGWALRARWASAADST